MSYLKKLINLVGHDIRRILRPGSQNMRSHAVVSTFDVTHLNMHKIINFMIEKIMYFSVQYFNCLGPDVERKAVS